MLNGFLCPLWYCEKKNFKDVLLRASPSHPIQFKPSPLPPHHWFQYSPVNHDDGWKCPVLPWDTELVSVSVLDTKLLFPCYRSLGTL